MEYRKLIKFYKGYVIVEIHKKVNKQDKFTLNEIDKLLKHISQVEKSCTDMDYYELNELIIWSFIYADSIDLFLNFKDND